MVKRSLCILLILFPFSVKGVSPGEFFKKYIKSFQKLSEPRDKIKLGEGLILDLEGTSERLLLKYLKISISKERIQGEKAVVEFKLSWPGFKFSVEKLLNPGERKNLKGQLPQEYEELKSVESKRVAKIREISYLSGSIVLYKKGKTWMVNSQHKISKKRDRFCISEHIKEAMQLNRKRKEKYSRLTMGKTRPLSNFLIATEKVALLVVKMQELHALPFNKKGLEILCKEMISMEKVPAFKNKVSVVPLARVQKFNRLWVGGLSLKIYKAYKKKDFVSSSTILRKELKKIEKFPGMYCMHRHVVESMLRASNYGPLHKKKAKSLGLDLRSVERISWNFILSQLMTFPLAYQIDKMAFPFQKKGIPIICQDIPFIPEY
jgi:hypothetical protein